MKSIIVLWSGAVVDIPAGWALCDGNNGTPDLRDRFVIGAGGTWAPDVNFLTNVVGGADIGTYVLAYIMKL